MVSAFLNFSVTWSYSKDRQQEWESLGDSKSQTFKRKMLFIFSFFAISLIATGPATLLASSSPPMVSINVQLTGPGHRLRAPPNSHMYVEHMTYLRSRANPCTLSDRQDFPLDGRMGRSAPSGRSYAVLSVSQPNRPVHITLRY